MLRAILEKLGQAAEGPAGKFQLAIALPASMFASPWIMQSSSNLIDKDLVAELRRLVLSGALGLWPCGYSGARHENLLAAELSREFDWSLTNPWHTGLTDLELDTGLPYIFNWADAQRPATLNDPRPAALFSSQIPEGNRQLVIRGSDEIYRSIEILRTCRDLPQVGHRAILLLDSLLPELMHEMTTMLAEYPVASVQTQLSPDLANLPDWNLGPGFTGTPIQGETPDLHPSSAQNNRELTALRSSALSDSDTIRNILELARPSFEENPPRSAPPAAEPRTLLASMQGLVAMPGNNFSVRFQGGTLKGFSGLDWQLDCPHPPTITLANKSRSITWETQSGVSLEAPGARGLRETRTVKHFGSAENSSHLDYIFIDGSDWLYIDGLINFPELADTSEPWNASIMCFSLRFDHEVHVAWNNGGIGRKLSPPIPPAPASIQGFLGATNHGSWHHIHGNDFRFWGSKAGPCLVVQKPDQDTHSLSWRVHRDRRGLWIECCAEAQWGVLNSAALSGRRHQFNLGLTVLANSLAPLPPRDDDWQTLINKPWSGFPSSGLNQPEKTSGFQF